MSGGQLGLCNGTGATLDARDESKQFGEFRQEGRFRVRQSDKKRFRDGREMGDAGQA